MKYALLILVIVLVSSLQVACDSSSSTGDEINPIPATSFNPTPTLSPMVSLAPTPSVIKECLVGPYLQSATPQEIRIMWESPQVGNSWVEWGETPSLGNRTDSYEDIGINDLSILAEYEDIFPRENPESVIHHVHLTDLKPDTPYFYRVVTQASVMSAVYSFTTPPLDSSEKPFTFVVYADTQRSPAQHSQITDSIIEYLPDNPAMIWVVGDTVEDGPNYDGFTTEFFDPIHQLSSQVPYYTAVGNHEYLHYQKSPLIYNNREINAQLYFAYADLPGDEHKYSFNYGNCHFIALETSGLSEKCDFGEGAEAQLAWLEADLIAANNDPNIDFIFAFHHHPYKSELMNQFFGGSTPCVEKFVELFEQYGVNAFFHGHVHAMERGNSRGAPLYWLDSSGGGAPLANWLGPDSSEENSFDWPEIQKAIDEHGFHIVNIIAGDSPEFNIKYVSLGDLYNNPREEPQLIDSINFKVDNVRPERPVCIYPVATNNPAAADIVFQASPFIDSDSGDYHHETHWQVTTESGEYPSLIKPAGLYPPELSEPELPLVVDRWIRYENIYGESADGTPIDTQSHDNLTDETITLEPNTTYFWRVRYRDGLGIAWSEWSDEASFKTVLEELVITR